MNQNLGDQVFKLIAFMTLAMMFVVATLIAVFADHLGAAIAFLALAVICLFGEFKAGLAIRTILNAR